MSLDRNFYSTFFGLEKNVERPRWGSADLEFAFSCHKRYQLERKLDAGLVELLMSKPHTCWMSAAERDKSCEPVCGRVPSQVQLLFALTLQSSTLFP